MKKTYYLLICLALFQCQPQKSSEQADASDDQDRQVPPHVKIDSLYLKNTHDGGGGVHLQGSPITDVKGIELFGTIGIMNDSNHYFYLREGSPSDLSEEDTVNYQTETYQLWSTRTDKNISMDITLAKIGQGDQTGIIASYPDTLGKVVSFEKFNLIQYADGNKYLAQDGLTENGSYVKKRIGKGDVVYAHVDTVYLRDGSGQRIDLDLQIAVDLADTLGHDHPSHGDH